jgi:hypothetical protein
MDLLSGLPSFQTEANADPLSQGQSPADDWLTVGDWMLQDGVLADTNLSLLFGGPLNQVPFGHANSHLEQQLPPAEPVISPQQALSQQPQQLPGSMQDASARQRQLRCSPNHVYPPGAVMTCLIAPQPVASSPFGGNIMPPAASAAALTASCGELPASATSALEVGTSS